MGRNTREMIAAATSPLFNQRGFAGASMSGIMAATGLQKGGIYNHFPSKDALALAAFEHSLDKIKKRLEAALEGKESAADRLLALAAVFASNVSDPIVEGGCPIFNTAVDADDSHLELRAKAAEAVDRWRQLVKGTVRKGISRGEFRPDADADAFATLFVASLEGGIVLSRLLNTPGRMEEITRYIAREIESMKAQ